MDGELIDRARRGDIAGYGELVRRYQVVAVRAAYLITGDTAAAEDVAQEAFVRAFKALDRFEPDAPFRPWLLQIVTHEALNRRRSDRRRVRIERQAFEVERADLEVDAPEVEVLAWERHDQLEEALSELKDMDRIVLIYRYLMEMPVNEIARVLGCTESTVRTRMSRALTRLREQMIERMEPSSHD